MVFTWLEITSGLLSADGKLGDITCDAGPLFAYLSTFWCEEQFLIIVLVCHNPWPRNVFSSIFSSLDRPRPQIAANILRLDLQACGVNQASKRICASDGWRLDRTTRTSARIYKWAASFPQEQMRSLTYYTGRQIPEEVAAKTDHENEFPMGMWKKFGEAG